jgi:HlyD family secretion protein
MKPSISPKNPGTMLLAVIAALMLAYSIHFMASSRPVLLRSDPQGGIGSMSKAPLAAERIFANGLLEPASEVISLAPQIGGLVAEVLVTPGDTVSKGQILIKLDAREAEAALRVAEASRNVIAEEATEAAVEFERATKELERARTLVISRAIAEQEASNREYEARFSETKIKRTQSRLMLAEAEIAQVRVRLEQHDIKAPITGQVLQVQIKAGEYASTLPSQSQKLITLGDMSALHVRLEIDEIDLPRLNPSAEAEIYLRGNPDQKWAATTVRIERVASQKKNLSGAISERVDTRVIDAVYRLQNPPPGAWWAVGLQAEASLAAK